MKLYLIAGEASGDLHGSNLIHALRRISPKMTVRAWGGDLMQSAGAELVKHYRDLAFMGFWEVVRHLPTILSNLAFCKKDILENRPDALVLIDYPGFNLRIAKWAKKQGIPVIYYIAPQTWAWKKKRNLAIERDVERLLCILPFEQNWFSENGVSMAEFVGHPLLDVVREPQRAAVGDANFSRKVIALMPGSRKQEIRRILPIMLGVMRQFPEYQFVVAGAPGISTDFYQTFLSGKKRVSLVQNKTSDVLRLADAALVTSGTATLETALHGVPQVVCYKGGWLSYQIAKRIIKVKYISLPNLILNEPIIAEQIQANCNVNDVGDALGKMLSPDEITRVRGDYDRLRKKLGAPGASERVAKIIVDYLK
jgi:lipid-A-disaccharide synthase